MGLCDDLEPLDDLVHLIYQSLNRFVLVSTVSDECWVINLGLRAGAIPGSRAKWWRARLSESDLLNHAKTKTVGALAHTVAGQILSGNLSIEGFDEDESDGAVELVLGPEVTDTLTIPMTPLSLEDSVSTATDIAFTIGIRVQQNLHAHVVPVDDQRSTLRSSSLPKVFTKSIGVRNEKREATSASGMIESTSIDDKARGIRNERPITAGHEMHGPIVESSGGRPSQMIVEPSNAEVAQGSKRAAPAKGPHPRKKRVAKKMEFESDVEE